jgi:MFS family permease
MDTTVQSNLKTGAAARWWTAGFLTVAYGVAQLDRNAINLLLPAIQSDLGLSDTQAGLLTGMAFAVLFSVASIPIGALADRIDRRWIIGLGLTAWSVLTALCAVARSFGGLFAIRLGVGIGEASLAPCAYPILVEIFPKSFTARAIGLYVAGATALSGIAIGLTGRLLDLLSGAHIESPWRIVFAIIAAPGILLALLSPTIAAGQQHRQKIDIIGASKTIAPALLYCGAAAYFAVLYILFGWTPSIFIREFGFTTAQAGDLLAGEQVLAGVIGALLGAWLADRQGPDRRVRTATRLAALGMAAFAGGLVTVALAQTPQIAVAGALTGALTGGLGMGVLGMAVQESSAPAARSRATAIYMLTINLFGTGLGPPLAGAFSDYLGPHRLRYGAAIAACGLAAIGIVALSILRRRKI